MESVRIYNETRHYYLKHRRAVEGVERFSFAWVKFGVSVRDLTLAESIATRAQRAKQPEQLPFAELPNCIYKPEENALWALRGARKLCRISNYFALSV